VAIEGSMNEYNFVKAAVLGLCCLLIFPLSARAAPADIFPPGPAAQGAIHWKDGYFYIDGKPVLIRSGSIHYARVPREMWRDRIWRLKMMGLNCVQTYVFWNASEPKEGQWDLTDNLDLDAWLSLAQEMGMYALVRVGPYACAEWEEGGYPAWLSIKAGMIQREMGPCLPFSDPHMDKIEAIVAKHQVSRGGNVVMMQVENEHSRGWGTDVDDLQLRPASQPGSRGRSSFPLQSLAVVQHGILDGVDQSLRRYECRDVEREDPRHLEDHRIWGIGLQLLHGPRRDELRVLRKRRAAGCFVRLFSARRRSRAAPQLLFLRTPRRLFCSDVHSGSGREPRRSVVGQSRSI
jgi:hypothetical protein